MTFDIELARKILLAIEERGNIESTRLLIDGEPAERVARHVELLHEAGFLDGTSAKDGAVMIRDLSWSGHEFVAATRNCIVWSALRSRFGADLNVMPFELVRKFAAKLTAEMIMGRAA